MILGEIFNLSDLHKVDEIKLGKAPYSHGICAQLQVTTMKKTDNDGWEYELPHEEGEQQDEVAKRRRGFKGQKETNARVYAFYGYDKIIFNSWKYKHIFKDP